MADDNIKQDHEEIKEKYSSSFPGKVREFFSGRSPILVAGIAAGVLLVAAGAVFFLTGIWRGPDSALPGDEQEQDAVSPGEEEVDKDDQHTEMLPQTTREEDEDRKIRDPFGEPAVLLGLISGGQGEDLAIIQASDTTYVASPGDIIDDYWTLSKIDGRRVVLEAEDEAYNLEFKASRSPDIVDDPGDEEAAEEEVEEEEKPDES